MELLIWLGIVFCALKAATFSGLNLAYFSVPVLRLNILAGQKDPQALKVLSLRSDPNFLLSTILWANVSYNVLLALLANSVMAGLGSFFFSTVVLTLVGEIFPQATFSRQALKFGAFFAPMIRFYQVLLYPIAKPSALALNYFLGKESPAYYSERDLIALIEEHLNSKTPIDISAEEGRGAIEFLKLDDRFVKDVGKKVELNQLLALNFKNGRLLKLDFKPEPEDPFIKSLLDCSHEWMIIKDQQDAPQLALDVACFIKAVFRTQKCLNVSDYCVKPIVVTDKDTKVSTILNHFVVPSEPINKISCSRKATVVVNWQGKNQKILTSDDLMTLILG
jgi:Mg2+/Co2+ transporter CorB